MPSRCRPCASRREPNPQSRVRRRSRCRTRARYSSCRYVRRDSSACATRGRDRLCRRSARRWRRSADDDRRRFRGRCGQGRHGLSGARRLRRRVARRLSQRPRLRRAASNPLMPCTKRAARLHTDHAVGRGISLSRRHCEYRTWRERKLRSSRGNSPFRHPRPAHYVADASHPLSVHRGARGRPCCRNALLHRCQRVHQRDGAARP